MGSHWWTRWMHPQRARAEERQIVTAKEAAQRELKRRRLSLDALVGELEEVQGDRSANR